MAVQNKIGGFAELLCCPTTLRDLFRFLLVFPLVRLVKMAFFFFCFFLLENNFKGEQRIVKITPNPNKSGSQWHYLAFIVVLVNRCYSNSLTELCKRKRLVFSANSNPFAKRIFLNSCSEQVIFWGTRNKFPYLKSTCPCRGWKPLRSRSFV